MTKITTSYIYVASGTNELLIDFWAGGLVVARKTLYKC